MIQQRKVPQEPTIAESSETESFTSESKNATSHTPQVGNREDANVSLDDLFADLKKELDTSNNESLASGALPDQLEVDDYKSIERSLRSLPKLQSTFDNNNNNSNNNSSNNSKSNGKSNGKDKSKTSAGTLKIYDPIPISKKEKSSDDTTDSRWFHMGRPELTPQLKRDLQIIQQRQALDPKRHYKREKWSIPKHFQMGEIIESSTGYYNQLKRKERGTSLVGEVLADDATKKYFKRKYGEIQKERESGKRAFYKKVKHNRKRF